MDKKIFLVFGIIFLVSLSFVSAIDNFNISSSTGSLFFVNGTSGKVGIGTANPSYRLYVNSSSYGSIARFNAPSAASESYIDVVNSNGVASFGVDTSGNAYISPRSASKGIRFFTSIGKEVYIDVNGNVGIGTTSPSQTLDVRGQGNFSGTIFINNVTDISTLGGGIFVNATPWSYINTTMNRDLNISGVIYVNASSGYVGIGTTSPNMPLAIKSSLGNNYVWIDTSTADADSAILFQEQGNARWSVVSDTSEGAFEIYSYALGDNVASFDETSGDMVVSGKVGIGTTSPTEKLTVNGNASINGTLYVTENGRVGIGTTSPDNPLHLHDTSPTFEISSADAGETLRIVFDEAESDTLNAALAYDGSDNTLRLQTGADLANSGALVVDSSGNVGIGAISLSSSNRLTVGDGSGDEGITIYSGSGAGDYGRIWFGDALGTAAEYQGYIQYDQGDGELEFGAGGDTKLLIDSSGNVGIGTTSPQKELHINSSDYSDLLIEGGSTARIILKDSGATTNYQAYDVISNSDDLSFRRLSDDTDSVLDTMMVIKDTGNVGIGTTSPSEKLFVAGNISSYNFNTTGTNTYAGVLAGDSNTGDYVTATGHQAGKANTEDYLTAIGYVAGYQNVGDYVTAIGHAAGQSNTGESLTATGNFAGDNNIGNYSSLFGYKAGYQNTGNSLTAMGYEAGIQNTGFESTALGFRAGYQNEGFYLTGVGLKAGWQNVGNESTFAGHQAGLSNAGNQVSGFGVQAGQSNTRGSVTAVGYRAAMSNVGSSLTATGWQAGYENTGDSSAFFGYGAGQSNIGNRSVSIGYSAGQLNTGNYLTATGYYAGRQNSGNYLTVIGYSAGTSNTGDRVSILGGGAGQSNSGDDLIAIGYQAGQSNIGDKVISIGYQAGHTNTGAYVTATGYSAGTSNIGNSSSMFGYASGQLNKGNYLTATGYSAGYQNIGNYSSGFGYEALRSNSGNDAAAIGYSAGKSNNANYLTAMGSYAGQSNSGDSLSAFGYSAGYQNTGDRLTAMGRSAGRDNIGYGVSDFGYVAGQDNTGDYLTAAGYYAGYQNIGNYSSTYGYEAGMQNTGNNVVALGYQAGKYNNDSSVFILKQNNVNNVPLIWGNFTSGDTKFGGNVNMSSYNLTMDGGEIYSNSTCIKISGASTTLEIC